MKLIFFLTALLLSISLLILQSNSFSTAEIRSDAILSIVSEESALITISYGEGRMLITNNTGENIEIESVEVIGESDIDIKGDDSSAIMSGDSKYFTLTGEELFGKVIKVIASWNGGSAEILSTIPELEEEVVDLLSNEEATVSESNNEGIDPEFDEVDSTLELDDLKTTPELIDELEEG